DGVSQAAPTPLPQGLKAGTQPRRARGHNPAEKKTPLLQETETESQPTASRVPIKSLQANSKACKDGLRAEQECRNGTHFLEHQLRRAQEVLRGTETQAAICNQTVVTLRASLEMAKADRREQLARVQELEGDTAALKQQLQNALAEVERLRQRNDGASGGNNDPASSANALSPLVAAVFLPLGLWDLQA
uniref:Bone marrow stromal antigen 2 n=1 Tax=Equus caballus TaxID=9796 RepID=A0A3Q2HGD6_HORSE